MSCLSAPWLLYIGVIFGSATVGAYKVAPIMSPPFIFQKTVNGTSSLKGFIPDFLDRIKESNRKCSFEFVNVTTRTGQLDRSWRGIMRALENNEADIGVGPVSKGRVTDKKRKRNRIHFTGKFTDHQGWTAVLLRPLRHDRDIIMEALTLFKPFTTEVWLSIIVAFAVVSVLLGIVNFIDPYEWRSLYKREKAPKTDAYHYSPMGSMFIVFSTLTWQGYERTPRSVAGRLLLICWMIFVLITLIMYIAGMANLLNNVAHDRSRDPDPVIDHPFALLDKSISGVKFGTVTNWPVIEHLEGHPDVNARKLGKKLKNRGENVMTVEDGLKRASNPNENYVFIIDTVIARFLTRDNCNIMTLPVIEPGDMKGYAFAISLDRAPTSNIADRDPLWVTCFEKQVNHLWRNESIQDLWSRWEKDYLYGRCTKNHNPDKSRAIPKTPPFVALTIYQFCGPLAFVALGIVLCIMFCIAEILVHFISNKLQKVNILGASSPIEEERRLHDDLDDDLKA